MNSPDVVPLLREAMITVVVIASPVLGVALLVGLITGFLQTATQIQDQTLSFIPKLISILVVGAMLLPWMLDRMIEYAATVFSAPFGF